MALCKALLLILMLLTYWKNILMTIKKILLYTAVQEAITIDVFHRFRKSQIFITQPIAFWPEEYLILEKFLRTIKINFYDDHIRESFSHVETQKQQIAKLYALNSTLLDICRFSNKKMINFPIHKVVPIN